MLGLCASYFLRIIFSLFVAILFASCATTSSISINKEPGPPTKLVVYIEGIKNNHGKLLAFIHDNSRSYYSDDNVNGEDFSAFRFEKVDPTVPVTTVIFENIPAGHYAINGPHDEDEDGALGRQIFPFPGMPSERYGISNDVFSWFSKASFEDALVEVRPPLTEITIKMSTHLQKLFGG